MVPMESHRERLLRLATDARKARGLDRQADLIRATGLSRSTVHRFEKGEAVNETALRKISRAIGWTPDSAQDVLAGEEPTLEARTDADDVSPPYEVKDPPASAPEGVGMIVRNTVIAVVGVLAPNTPLSEVQEIEALALEAVRQRGGRPLQRHPQAYQDAKATDSSSE